jgi:hypothetical protein
LQLFLQDFSDKSIPSALVETVESFSLNPLPLPKGYRHLKEKRIPVLHFHEYI